MAQYKTPDVYVVEKSIMPPSVAEVPTAIPAFIGYTEKTKDSKGDTITQMPKRITSMVEYETLFGGRYAEGFVVKQVANSDELTLPTTDNPTLSNFFLYQAISHFFTNGGGTCYIVSIGGYDTALKEKTHFTAGIKTLNKIDEVTIIACPESIHLGDQGHYDVQNTSLSHSENRKDRFSLVDVKTTGDIPADASNMRNIVAQGLKYGAAYYPYLRTSITRTYDEKQVMVTLNGPTQPQAGEGGEPTAPMSMHALASTNTAIYNQLRTLLNTNYLVLPPSAAIAGVIAKTDGERGVWKAPANVALAMVVEPTVAIDNSEQEDLNVDVTAGKSINAIRNFVGKGTLVWGARTLAGNDNEWRYVPVRRLFNMVEESIQKSTAFAVFEPNTPFTWLKIKTMIESYLENLWQQGAFFGTSPEQAFFVNVGLGQTMTEDDINNGYMKIDIGLAAVRPAEFIVLTFTHKSLEG